MILREWKINAMSLPCQQCFSLFNLPQAKYNDNDMNRKVDFIFIDKTSSDNFSV